MQRNFSVFYLSFPHTHTHTSILLVLVARASVTLSYAVSIEFHLFRNCRTRAHASWYSCCSFGNYFDHKYRFYHKFFKRRRDIIHCTTGSTPKRSLARLPFSEQTSQTKGKNLSSTHLSLFVCSWICFFLICNLINRYHHRIAHDYQIHRFPNVAHRTCVPEFSIC